MAQAKRSIRQQIAIRHAIARRAAAKTAPVQPATVTPAVTTKTAPVVLWGDYTVLTPIATWKSSRSRKRVVRRVKDSCTERDVAMLLDHEAYSVIGTVRAPAPLPVLAMGDIYVCHATGQVHLMGRSMRAVEQGDRLYFEGTLIAKAAQILVDRDKLAAMRPATDLARQRHTLLTDATRACNLRFSRPL